MGVGIRWVAVLALVGAVACDDATAGPGLGAVDGDAGLGELGSGDGAAQSDGLGPDSGAPPDVAPDVDPADVVADAADIQDPPDTLADVADVPGPADADAQPDAQPDTQPDAQPDVPLADADADPVEDTTPDVVEDTTEDAPPEITEPPADPADPGPYVPLVSTAFDNPVWTGGFLQPTANLCEPGADSDTPLEGPLPLVIMSPGFAVGIDAYMPYCEHLASQGFLVILRPIPGLFPDHSDEAQDTVTLLDWLASADSGLADRIDWDRVATAGHSLGGKLSIYAAVLDPRVAAVAAWDPVDCGGPAFVGCPDNLAPDLMGGLSAPLLLLGETTDEEGGGISPACAPAGENYQAFYDATPGEAVSITIAGANHTQFAPIATPIDPCKAPSASADFVQAMVRRTTVAHLRFVLDGDAAMSTFLTGPAVQALVADGLVTVESKP